MGKLKTRSVNLLLYLVGRLSRLSIRSRKIWVFSSWGGKIFSDNSKWLFLYCASKRASEVQSIFFINSPSIRKKLRALGFTAIRPKSIKGIFYALRAGVFVFDSRLSDFSLWLSRGAVKVNLWHGIPLKKIGADVDKEGQANFDGYHGPLWKKTIFFLDFPWILDKYDMMISTCPKVSNIFSSAFRIEKKQVPVTGFPRNDILVDENLPATIFDAPLCDRLNDLKKRDKKIVAYIPTFRDSERKKSSLPLDYTLLNSFLREKDAYLIIKLHPYDVRNEPSLDNFDHMEILKNSVDLYPVLRLADILITDYSSVFYDFLLLNRPIVFFAYDLDNYLAECRSMYIPYVEAAPGPIATDFESLIKEASRAISKPKEHMVKWAEKRSKIKTLYHSFDSGGSSGRVFGEIYSRFSY